MMIIRPITHADLPALVGLAKSTGVGLTTLPPNEAELAKRVDAAVASFAGTAQKADEIFLFVLKDTIAKRVVGTCGLATAVGLRGELQECIQALRHLLRAKTMSRSD